MSYRRTFSKQIQVYYSGSVSYPASQHGGTVSYSGSKTETVHVNIDVDTTPFDSSVNNCNSNVKLLTGAVVATESAQILSIKENSRRIGQTIVNGFFKTISSEISQQIMELSTRLDALLLHLRSLGQRCVEKQAQMERDYQRLASRYSKTFDDLNRELENRIYELDKPTFRFKELTDSEATRSTSDDLVGSAAITGAESAALQARISASRTKHQANDTICHADKFLRCHKSLEQTIDKSMHSVSEQCHHFAPVAYVMTESEQRLIDKQIYHSSDLPIKSKQDILDKIESKNWKAINPEELSSIRQYFNSEVRDNISGNDRHSNRVRETIYKLFGASTIESCTL